MIMTVSDWGQIDTTVTSLPTNVTENELFAADLFGSEIIDMYGASEDDDGCCDNTDHDNKIDEDVNKQLTSVPIPSTSTRTTTMTTTTTTTTTTTGATLSMENQSNGAIDVLGGVRPSTDISELSDLLPPLASPPALPQVNVDNNSQQQQQQATINVSANSTTIDIDNSSNTNPKKRTISESIDSSNTLTLTATATATAAATATEQPVMVTAAPAPPPTPKLSTTKATRSAKTSRRKSPTSKNGIVSPSAVLSSNSITGQAAAFIMRQKQLKSQNMSSCNNTAATAAAAAAAAIISPLLHPESNMQRSDSGTTTPPTSSSDHHTPIVTPVAPTHTSSASVTTPLLLHSDSATATAASLAAAAASRPKTEADFAAVAQAAVSSLILSAGANVAAQHLGVQNNVTDEDSDEVTMSSTINNTSHPNPLGNLTIDTSTAHIAALTSSNWMQACASPATLPHPSPATLPHPSSTANPLPPDCDEPHLKKQRREHLTPDERAKQNRVRNREHARNTRLRKKAYVEELKRTLTELVAQRDAGELERRQNERRELEQREVRFRVMEEFLRLRGLGEDVVGRWVAILEEEFVMRLPKMSYRAMVSGRHSAGVHLVTEEESAGEEGREGHEQMLRGAEEAMGDALLLFGMLESTLGLDEGSGKGKIGFSYDCHRKKFFMDDCTAVLDWTVRSFGGMAQGAPQELEIKGVMKATFSPASNKLTSAQLLFDTASVLSQLKIINPTLHGNNNNSNIITTNGLSAKDANALIDSIQMPCFTGMGAMTTSSSTSATVPRTTSPTPPNCNSPNPDIVESLDTSVHSTNNDQVSA